MKCEIIMPPSEDGVPDIVCSREAAFQARWGRVCQVCYDEMLAEDPILVEDFVPLRWRTGRRVFRTLYLDGNLVGLVDTKELADAIVAAMNARP